MNRRNQMNFGSVTSPPLQRKTSTKSNNHRETRQNTSLQNLQHVFADAPTYDEANMFNSEVRNGQNNKPTLSNRASFFLNNNGPPLTRKKSSQPENGQPPNMKKSLSGMKFDMEGVPNDTYLDDY